MDFRDLPIKRKLAGAIMLTSLTVLALTSLALITYELYAYKQTTRRTLSTIADIIASNSTAVLIYDDHKLASQILAGLHDEPEIEAAALYDKDGQLYVSYPLSLGPTGVPATPGVDGIDFGLRQITLFEPVIEGQNRVGTLYLRGDLADMYRRLGVYGLVLLSVLGCSGLVALSLAAYFQRLISQPILNLANTARIVSERKDYSVRAVKLSNDELGGFTETFNSMLHQVQESHSALRESEERLSAVFQQAGAGIAQTDVSGRFLMVNDRYCEIVGRPRESLLQLRMQDIIHPADLSHHQFLSEHSARDGSSFVVETRYDRPQGGFVWVRNSVAFIRDAAGTIESAIAVTEDITSSKRTEKELERARDDALAASRAKDDFLATLSHELRTPLNPVLLLASEAAEDPTLPPAVRSDFATIRNNVELEARLIDDLLDLTRITRGKLLLDLKPHDMHAILQDALATVRAELERKQIVTTLKFDAGRAVVLSDAVRLQQVFWNVLKNAVKFTPEQGGITVHTHLAVGDSLVVEITDTGIGLEPAEIERIFDAFSQGDHAGTAGSHRFGGVGLGLAISRMLVELHRGSIRAESPGRGHGATFRIELPLLRRDVAAPRMPAADGPPARAAAAAGSAVPETMRRRILLVEDHAPTRTTLQQLLMRRRYEVLAAGTVAEARAIAAKESFDFVISDIGLPDGNAYELMSDLRAEKGLTGIALTGYGMESDIARSHAAGFVVHLTKPLRVQSLDEALARISGATPA
ncbi:ATP-binding protein [Opitutus terrae]|uniref:histidine kinase n=1 Tax=Opitutus terrae (strain DSM 11246 / JCM 15787 / PB90-1) TaxID=452637 RepID=B1ZVH0_OPITP|nr:ATP-binding protein [Opitutus terrae]ACB74067.1 multi-sensor hybrid histidine kinase [Opitutus terrae PB90-1]